MSGCGCPRDDGDGRPPVSRRRSVRARLRSAAGDAIRPPLRGGRMTPSVGRAAGETMERAAVLRKTVRPRRRAGRCRRGQDMAQLLGRRPGRVILRLPTASSTAGSSAGGAGGRLPFWWTSSRSGSPPCASGRARSGCGEARQGPPRSGRSSPDASCPVRAPGDAVEVGMHLLVVEAMKMQNELRAPARGRGGAGRGQAGGRPSRWATCWSSSADRRIWMHERDQGASVADGSLTAEPRSRAGDRALAVDDPGPGAAWYPSGASRLRPHRRSRSATCMQPADRKAVPDADLDLGLPGEFPFTRGVQPTMYRGRLWTMRQYAGFGTRRRDQRALPIPARAGPDGAVRRLRPADADGLRRRLARGRRARSAGSASPSTRWRDMDALFDGIPLDEVSTSMTINATAADPARLYVAVGETPGRAARRRCRRHDPERHPQGVRRPRHLHLPAGRRRCA